MVPSMNGSIYEPGNAKAESPGCLKAALQGVAMVVLYLTNTSNEWKTLLIHFVFLGAWAFLVIQPMVGKWPARYSASIPQSFVAHVIGVPSPPSHPTPAQKCNVMAFPENGKCFRGNYCIVGQFKIDKNTFVWIAEILLVEIKEMLLGIYCWKIGMEPFLFCWNVVMLLGEMMIWSVAWC